MSKRSRKISSKQPTLIEAGDAGESLTLCADLNIHASAGQESSSRRFDMVAYTGAPMSIRGYRAAVVVDLAGLNVPSQNRPILLDHASDVESIAGQSDSISVVDGKLRVAGEIMAGNGRIDNVLSLASRGFRWQASIGARPERVEELRAGDTAIVNGQEVRGPLNIVRQATLREISIVAMGADDRTATSLAASAATQEIENMSDENVKAEADVIAAAAAPAPVAPATGADANAEILAAISALQKEITEVKLSNVRDSRPAAPSVHVEAGPTTEVLEAAFAVGAGLPNVEAAFAADTLEAANKHYRRGVGLQEMLIEAARMHGYRGRAAVNDDTLGDLLKASFSTASIPGLLSNVAHKFLLSSFNAVDQSWRQVATTRPVSDFKTYSSYRLTGGMTMEKVGAGGEIKHGTLGEVAYTNSAESYGKMLTISRQMLINDDLGALTQLPARLGRGAALAFNSVFWSEFLADNSTFYTTARGNYFSGADSALAVDSLTKAERLFMEQVDPDGNPMAISPAILLVPPSLYVPATTLMRSTEIRDTNANNKYPTINPHSGKFSVVQTTYLNTASVSGGSSTAWFLLANPGDMSAIEVAFLNGNETPIVEQASASFETLGIQMRAYWDWGAKKQEYRAAVKSKGAA
jgi:hypothetical protein